MEPVEMNDTVNESKPQKTANPLFPFMGIGSLVYALLYTFFLYKNSSGITYPFFVGGTCLFFFLYLKKSGTAAKKFSIFLTVSLILLGISTCSTDSWILLFFNKLGIFLLFFYMLLHNLYQDKKWDLSKYFGAIINITCTSIIFIFRPFTDLTDYLACKSQKSAPKNGKGKYVFFGILIALPLLFVILLLLCSADIVFSNILDFLLGDVFTYIFTGNIWGITALFLFAFFASYCILCRLSLRTIKEEVTDKRTAEPVIGITFTGIISLVYLIFCLIQMIYLFGGLGTLPEGYTYAMYAREGFFQLVFVCLINLALVLICMKRFRKNKVLKGILIFISLCTYIMIASSAYRMLLYIGTYHLTFLRLLVLWGLCVIFLLISGTLIMIFHEEFPFVKYCVVTVTVMYLFFSFAHPDYWIARYNLSHVYATAAQTDTGAKEDSSYRGYNDFYYLRNLSADAAPVIFEMADELGYGSEAAENRWFATYASRLVRSSYASNNTPFPVEEGSLPQKQPVRKINISRQAAYRSYTNYYQQHESFQRWMISYIYKL